MINHMRPILGWLKYAVLELPWRVTTDISSYDCVFITTYIYHNNKVTEPFYGDLPCDLEAQGYRVLRFGKIAWHYNRDLENTLPNDHLSFSHVISKMEGIQLIFKSIISRSVSNQLMIKVFINSFLKKINDKNCAIRLFYPFEGNIWEQACVENKPCAIGYQHNALTPLHDKRSLVQTLPHKIISTGISATQIMRRHLNIPADKIIDGYSLRLGLEENSLPKESPFENFLVVLQGHENERKTLQFLMEFKKLYPDYTITLRPHPAHPININHYAGFTISDNFDLQDDLKSLDVCLYTSSSAAFEAIAMGLPVIHMQCGLGDPLFECPAMHKTANSANGLAKALSELEVETDEQAFATAAKYCKTYFKPYKKENVKDFIQWLNL